MLPQIRFSPDAFPKPFTRYVADFWKDDSSISVVARFENLTCSLGACCASRLKSKKAPNSRFFTLQTPSNRRFAVRRMIGIFAVPLAQKSTSATGCWISCICEVLG
jgi:hypothetical protein